MNHGGGRAGEPAPTDAELLLELESRVAELLGKVLSVKLALQRLEAAELTSEEALDAVAFAVEGQAMPLRLIGLLAKRDKARRAR